MSRASSSTWTTSSPCRRASSRSSRTASCRFGYIYLRKPGRLRVEYDPPVPILLVADGGLLSYYDKDDSTN